MIIVLPIIGPAIAGSGQYLIWTPCHQRSIRLQEDIFTAVRCAKCSVPWEITLEKAGVDWLALWRP